MLDDSRHDIAQFEQCSTHFRFSSGMWLGEFSVYLVASGGLLIACATTWGSLAIVSSVIAVVGIALSVTFLVITERAADYMEAAGNRLLVHERRLRWDCLAGIIAEARMSGRAREKKLGLASQTPLHKDEENEAATIEPQVLTARKAVRAFLIFGIIAWASLLFFCIVLTTPAPMHLLP